MPKLTLNAIGSRYGSIDALNDNFDAIETALENTLSRDGSTPNTMSANLDMNGNSILNVDSLNGADASTLSSNLDVVAQSISEVNDVAENIGDISEVADNLPSVNIVADNISDVNSVAAVSADLTTVINNLTAIQNAATNANNAATSATNAASSATSAATSASTASTQATNAASSASSAQAASNAALAALDSFDDRYLGQKTSDPTLDNDGNALVAGALYFNTTSDVMKVYDGSAWVAAYASLSGALLVNNNLSDVANTTSALTNLGAYPASNPSGYTSNTGTVTSVTGGSYLTGGTITTSGTLAVDATSANTASKIVARDASGNFSAGTITASLSGNATTATTATSATSATTATTATNLAGGGAGQVPYQSASGTTAMLAAGTAGQVLRSNGASAPSWVTPSSGGVTSLTAGNGITVSASTGAVTVALDFYTGSTINNTSYPVGSYLLIYGSTIDTNATTTLWCPSTTGANRWQFGFTSRGTGSSALSGTWRARGGSEVVIPCGAVYNQLFQRTA